MTFFARFISWLFLPLLIPIYALLITMYVPAQEFMFLGNNNLYVLNDEQKIALLYLFTLFSFLAPSLVIVFLFIQGKIGSVMLEKRKERIIPSLAVIGFGIALLTMIYRKIPVEMTGFGAISGLAWGSFFTVLLLTLLTLKFKVSLHAGGMGILCAFLLVYDVHMVDYNFPILVATFLISGLVMSMRMYLGAHNLWQSLIGYFFGFTLTFMATAFTST